MDSIFLSYSFSKPEDRVIVADIEDIFRSFDLRANAGTNLGGDDIDDGVRDQIAQSEGIVAVASRRNSLGEGKWTTHDWIRDELAIARTSGKQSIVLIEDGVEMGGSSQNREHIPFHRDDINPALLKLAKTLGIWKKKAGNRLKVRLLPDELADELNVATFQYRFIFRGEAMDWHSITPIPEPGGIFLTLRGVRDGYLIQVNVSSPKGVRSSPATAQTMPIKVE